jgi:hypothetical protein
MRQWALVAATVLLVGVVAAGCSSKQTVLPGVTVDKGKGGTVTVQTGDGKLEMSAPDSGQAKVPDGFPIKVINGAKVESSLKTTANGKVGYTLTLSVQQDAKAVADFYEAELKGAQQKVDRNEIESDGSLLITLTGDGATDATWLTVSRDKGATGVNVTIFWGAK